MNTLKTIQLNNNQLKIIAVFLMIIDHIGLVFFPQYKIFRIIGRLAFPIFAFCVAEGYMHTHSRKKYILTLLLFAVLSEIPYDLMVSGKIFSLNRQNVLWTFLISLLYLEVEGEISNKTSGSVMMVFRLVMLMLVMPMITTILCADYGYGGFLTVFSFVILTNAQKKLNQQVRTYYIALSMVIFAVSHLCIISSSTVQILGINVHTQTFALLALPILYLYNGERGKKRKWIKYSFYMFYPLHMLILWTIHTLNILD